MTRLPMTQQKSLEVRVMVCDEAYLKLPEGSGYVEVLRAYADKLYRVLNESPSAFMTIAGKYQELRILVENGKKYLMLRPSEVRAFEDFLRCVSKAIENLAERK